MVEIIQALIWTFNHVYKIDFITMVTVEIQRYTTSHWTLNHVYKFDFIIMFMVELPWYTSSHLDIQSCVEG